MAIMLKMDGLSSFYFYIWNTVLYGAELIFLIIVNKGSYGNRPEESAKALQN